MKSEILESKIHEAANSLLEGAGKRRVVVVAVIDKASFYMSAMRYEGAQRKQLVQLLRHTISQLEGN